MRKILVCGTAVVLALAFALPADAAKSNQKMSADVQASCKAQAAKKFSAIHFLKRRDFVNKCVAQHNNAAKHAKAKPARQETTGQAPSNGQAMPQPMSPPKQDTQQPKQ